MLKKILLIFIVILILIALALGVRIFFEQSNQSSMSGEPNIERGGIFGFLNFGGETNTGNNMSEGELRDQIDTTSQNRPLVVPTLRQITTTPVSGATFIGTSTIRYVDRGTGHIYDTDLLSYETEKVSNTTIPQVYEALWLQNGDGVIYRQLDGTVIKTTHISLVEPTSTSTGVTKDIVVTFLPDFISDIDVSPNQQSIALLNSSSVVIGSPTNLGGTDFTLTGKEWLLDWTDNQNLFVTSKASSQAPGYGYSYTLSGSIKRVLDNIRGLTTNAEGSYVLYSGSSQAFSSLNTETGEIIELSPKTLPEKCDFILGEENYALCAVPKTYPSGTQLPDLWYQGSFSLEDTIGIYSLEGGDYESLYSPEESFDIILPAVNTDATYLLFVNKNDLTLWTLRIEEFI